MNTVEINSTRSTLVRGTTAKLLIELFRRFAEEEPCSDPAFSRWMAEGAPSVQCGGYAPFEEPDEPAPDCCECGQMIEGWAHQDDDGRYYCDACCPVCEDMEYDSEWCTCLDTVPSGECPHCHKPVLPF